MRALSSGLSAAGVRVGDQRAEQFGRGEEAEVVRVGVPFEATGERAQLDVRAYVAHDPSDAVADGVVDGLADGGDPVGVLPHPAIPFVITSASRWATGAEQTPS